MIHRSVSLVIAIQAQVDFLMLPHWRSITVEETAQVYEVEALPLSQPSSCPHCDGPTSALQAYSTQQQSIKDAPVRGKHVHINFTRQRYRCSQCKRTSLQPLCGINGRRRATERLVNLIGTEAFSKTFSRVSEETGVSSTSVRNIFAEKVLYLEQSVQMVTPRVLGLDEIYVQGKVCSVLADLEARRAVEFLPETGVLKLCQFLLRMPQRERVEVVIMDFRRSYFEVVRRVLPQAAVVISKWDVLQLAQRAVTTVLRKLREKSTADQRLNLSWLSTYLHKSSSQSSVAKKETFTELCKLEPDLREAHRLRQEFFDIWKFKDRQKAEERYDNWMASIPRELFYVFSDLLKIMDCWRQEIFNYFDHCFTDAFNESVSHRIRVVQMVSPSCSLKTIRAKVLYREFVRRPSSPRRPKIAYVQKGKVVKRRQRARRAPAPGTFPINDKKPQLDQESKEQFKNIVPQPDEWLARFPVLTRRKKQQA
jgi:transposase